MRIFHFNCKTTNFLLRQIMSAKKLQTLNKHQLKNILFKKFLFFLFLPFFLSFVQYNSSSAKNSDCDSLNKGTMFLTNESFNFCFQRFILIGSQNVTFLLLLRFLSTFNSFSFGICWAGKSINDPK